MNEKEQKQLLEQFHAIQKVFAQAQEAKRQREAAESERRARLTPAQRATEDRAIAARNTQEARQKASQKIAKLGDPVRKADTWTIANFCWLLLAEKPGDPEGFTFFDGRDSKVTKRHKQYREILESCIGTRLQPVNPKDPPVSFRFAVDALVNAARAKDLGHHAALADVLGIKPQLVEVTPKAAPAVMLAAKGTESRERNLIRRRKALLDMARAIAHAGEGTVYQDRIALSINGKELNRRFQAKYPEWQVAEKTFEADRTAIKPRIVVATGRPRQKTPA